MTRNDIRPTSVRFGLGLVILLVGLLAINNPVNAQRSSASVGFGGQIGDPSGVTLKLRDPGGVSYDFMAAWDSGDFFFLNVHGLFERHVGRHNNVHFFYGPGGYIGVRERNRRDDDTIIGISATVGLGVILEQFELFGQLIPRLDLTPGTDGEVGAGIGVRYYF
ncbi:MAG TPA: hypothetical protein VMO47_05085 [Rhodothermales bacterium]|nr:hypothetical protein [Rhodothermales bacterium]